MNKFILIILLLFPCVLSSEPTLKFYTKDKIGASNQEEYRAKLGEIDIEEHSFKVRDTLNNTLKFIKEVTNSFDKGTFKLIAQRSTCLAIFPKVFKTAVLVGGTYGRGVMVCKLNNGGMSLPLFVELKNLSIGFQAGSEVGGYLIGVKNSNIAQQGTDSLNIGADIGAAFGPLGRSAEFNFNFSGDVLFTMGKTKGLFLGASLQTAKINIDKKANKDFYKRKGIKAPYALILTKDSRKYNNQVVDMIAEEIRQAQE